MEKEIYFNAGALALNLFAEKEPSPKLRSLLGKTLEVLAESSPGLLKKPFRHVELNLNIVEDGQIQELNGEYRGKNKTTDVLSFPLQENIRGGEYDDFDGRLELGDIFVAVGVCARQAEENSLSFEEEFVHLFVHGFLHLCGYDHEINDEEDALMRGLEDKLMEAVAKKNGP